MNEEIRNAIEKIVSASGVTAYAFAKQEDIVYDYCFRDICKSNSCGQYGQCWMCPPDVGDIEELMARTKKYENAVLYQTVAELEDSFDVEGMAEGKKIFSECSVYITKEVKKLGLEDYMQLGVGGCGICESCAKRDGEPCRYPELAVPSLETCGIFVSETAKNVGLKYINGQNTVTYFGMILF